MTKLTALNLIEKLLAYGFSTIAEIDGMGFKKPCDYKKYFIRLKTNRYVDAYEIEKTVSFNYNAANNADEIFIDGGLTYCYFDDITEFEIWTEDDED